jgi:hypothetical protein
MKRAAAKGMLLPCLLLVAITSRAQKQNFTFEQIFKNGSSIEPIIAHRATIPVCRNTGHPVH